MVSWVFIKRDRHSYNYQITLLLIKCTPISGQLDRELLLNSVHQLQVSWVEVISEAQFITGMVRIKFLMGIYFSIDYIEILNTPLQAWSTGPMDIERYVAKITKNN